MSVASARPGDNELHPLDDIPLRPAKVDVERRNHVARSRLVDRIRCEFEEMPGTSLTLAQASRLLGLPADAAGRIFAQLVQDGVLRQSPDGRYQRRGSAA
jgi:hypothetical protein